MTSYSFLLVALVAVVVSMASAKPTWRDLESYSFEQFVTDFRLPFSNSSVPEFAHRRGIFLAELVRVKLHNRAAGKTWKEGVNKFSAMTADEKKVFFMGRSKGADRSHKPTHLKSSLHASKAVSDLPASVDWRSTGIVNAVKDQG